MRWSRSTLRTRLTLVYGGLFLLGGLLLLFLTYARVTGSSPLEGTGGNSQEGSQVIDQTDEGVIYTEKQEDAVRSLTDEVWDQATNAVLNQGVLSLLLVGTATIALGWFVAGRMLRPLQQITDTAGRIAESPAADRGLRERIKIQGPQDELRELAETFNRMLERLDHSFDGQRAFISNASHELRTPLTVARALLEVAVNRKGASVEVRQLGETLLEVNARHERLIEGLLLLTRSERALADKSYVDLADMAVHVVSQTPTDGIEVTADCEEAPTLGEPVLLERVVSNLVENAVRYNRAEDGWVKVTTGTDEEGHAVLTVANTGPLVPPYEVPGLFEPFRRLGTERLATASKGAGLGLSIVRAIVRAHGGEVTAEARIEGGLVATVTLPGAED